MKTGFLIGLLWVLLAFTRPGLAEETLIVSAEGLADPNADTYQRDKGLMLEDLRQDARKQVIEKAVGTLVSSNTLVENYSLIQDRVMTQSKGLIKRIIKESDPWEGKDGFVHLLLKAEVHLQSVQGALQQMSQAERINLLKERGNPTISVAVKIRDAERGSEIKPERSEVAENLLKEHFKKFGYRVWSEDQARVLKLEVAETSQMENDTQTTVSVSQIKAADFTIIGETKFKKISVTLKASGLTLTKYALTSWTVKCIDNNTAEEVYFNNKVPRNKSWADEDQALEDVGRMIGMEFSKEFFESHLMKPTKIYQLQALGLPDYDTGVLLKKEFIGLRPVINVDFRDFDANGLSRFEVEFAGGRGNFLQLINSTVLTPLNRKCREDCFKLLSAHGDMVKIRYASTLTTQELTERFEKMPPSSLATAPPERLRALVKDKATLERVAILNPDGVAKLAQQGDPHAATAVKQAVRDF
ncbi:conserved hypothetical protein [Gammaproteobacteria bacterium]